MKKYLKIIIPLIFIGVLGFFGFEIYTKIQHKREVAENIKNLPKFEYQNSYGGVFTNENLEKDIPTLFIYFNTECEFCNEETKMIKENIQKFANV